MLNWMQNIIKILFINNTVTVESEIENKFTRNSSFFIVVENVTPVHAHNKSNENHK